MVTYHNIINKIPTYFHKTIYFRTLRAPGVIDIINNDRSLVEPITDIVDNALERYNEDIELNIDPFSQLDNDEVKEEIDNKDKRVDQ